MNNTQDLVSPKNSAPRYRPLIYIALVLFVMSSFSACAVKRTHGGPSGQIMKVRTTAYHHSEPGGSVNGIGGRLAPRHSAASDWSWLPVGTRFRILETGEDYIIEDYGSALVGRETIDLYKFTRREMNKWGVRHVDIKILEWGSWAVSLKVLEPRARHKHVRKMVEELRKKVPRKVKA